MLEGELREEAGAGDEERCNRPVAVAADQNR